MARRLQTAVKEKFRRENTKYSSEDNAIMEIGKPKCDFIVEGQTEDYYFKSLKNNNLLPNEIAKIHNLKGDEGGDIFDKCKKCINKLFTNPRPNRLICVIDVDKCCGNNNQTNYLKFKSILNTYKKEISKKQIVICESLPTIEFWFLAHYINISRYLTANDAVTELKKVIPNYSKSISFLDNLDWNGLNNHLQTAILSQSKIPEESKLSYSNDVNISYSNIYKIFKD